MRKDMRDNGWKLVEDLTFASYEFEIVSILTEKDKRISLEEMLQRVKDVANKAGQSHAEWLLEHQDAIPQEWRNGTLIFAGTVWDRPGYGLCVPYLIFSDEWRMFWGNNDRDGLRRSRIVTFK